jgi:hypothetical protein
MAVLLGESGQVELRRTGLDEVLRGTVGRSDVNYVKDRFSFNFPLGALITGDQVEIKAVDGGYLDFIPPSAWKHNPPGLPMPAAPGTEDYNNAGVVFRYGTSNEDYSNPDITSAATGRALEDDYASGFTSAEFAAGTADYNNADVQPRSSLGFLTQYRDGVFYLFVDEVGAIRLYQRFDDAISGEPNGRVQLVDPLHSIDIEVRVSNNNERILAQVASFELNTERDAVDITALTDEFRRNTSGLISGSGRIECFFDYERRDCDPMTNGVTAGGLEMPIYMNQLLVRTKIGSEFWAKLTLVRRGAKPYGDRDDYDDEVWYEFDARITNVGMAFSSPEPIRTTIEFVTTGQIKLRTRYTSNYLLREGAGANRMLLEENQSGYLVVEETE